MSLTRKISRIFEIDTRWLFRNCDAVIAISESVQSALARDLRAEKLHVVHHGVDPQYRYDGPPDEPPFVLHVSIAAKRKNPDAIVETARRLDAPFVVAGSGWAERFAGVPDTENVDVRGYVPESDLVDLYHDAAVFYFPTRHEGFGLPVLEAMAASTAVVTTDVYSVPEVTGDAAVLRDPHDTDAHVAAVERLLEDGDDRRALARRARERASQFTWERAASETEAVYRRIGPASTTRE